MCHKFIVTIKIKSRAYTELWFSQNSWKEQGKKWGLKERLFSLQMEADNHHSIASMQGKALPFLPHLDTCQCCFSFIDDLWLGSLRLQCCHLCYNLCGHYGNRELAVLPPQLHQIPPATQGSCRGLRSQMLPLGCWRRPVWQLTSKPDVWIHRQWQSCTKQEQLWFVFGFGFIVTPCHLQG